MVGDSPLSLGRHGDCTKDDSHTYLSRDVGPLKIPAHSTETAVNALKTVCLQFQTILTEEMQCGETEVQVTKDTEPASSLRQVIRQ